MGSMKDRRSRRNEYLVLQDSTRDMCVGANQAMIADRARMTMAATDHCVLHDDAVCPDPDPSSALTNEASSIQDPGSWPNYHVAAYRGVGRHPSGSRYFWMFTPMSDEHDLLPPNPDRLLVEQSFDQVVQGSHPSPKKPYLP
jgi:hypothetical protein